MPTLPIIIERQPVGALELPRQRVSGAERAFKALGAFGEALEQAQAQQDEIDVKKQGALLDSRFNELKEEVRSEPNFAKREELYRTKASEYLAETLQTVESPRVQKGLSDVFSITLPRKMAEFKKQNHTEWGSARVAETDALGELLADKIISTTDPQEAEMWRQVYNSQVTSLSDGPFAPLRPDQAENLKQTFRTKVESKRARAMILDNPPAFLAAKRTDFANLADDEFLKFREEARRALERNETRQEKIFKDVREVVETRWSALANQGRLSVGDLKDALEGRHPYITPDRARQYQQINEDPPAIGGGADSVRAVMTEYHSGPSSFERISRARKELMGLVRQGIGGKLLDRALDELQTDERTERSIEAQRINREVTAGIDELKSVRPPMPINIPIFRNMDKQQEAKVKSLIRRGVPKEQAIKQVLEEAKQRAETIPETTKKILELKR